MRPDKETPQPARAWGADSTSTNLGGNFQLPASIRRYGRGDRGYEAAKQAWCSENPAASPRDYETAMRRIARAVGV